MEGVAGTLSTLLSAALKSKNAATERMQPSPHDENSMRLVNDRLMDDDIVFGSLVEWTAGKFQPVIEMDPLRPTLEVTLMEPGERKEFLAGMGYFLAFGNHLVFSKGRAVGFSTLEHHLEWLLRDCAQLVPGGTHLLLLDAPQKSDTPITAKVKSVTLSPAPLTTQRKKSAFATESISTRNEITRALMHALKKLNLIKLGEEKLDRLLDARNLRASIRISYSGTPDQDGVQLLDVLAHAMRNAEGDWGSTIEVPGVGLIRGEDLMLKTTALVPYGVGEDPDMQSMATIMRNWIAELIARNDIPAEV